MARTMERNGKQQYDDGFDAGQKWVKHGASAPQILRLSRLGRRYRGKAFPSALSTPEAVFDHLTGPAGKRPSYFEFEQFWEKAAGRSWSDRPRPFFLGFVDAVDEHQKELDDQAQAFRDRMHTIDTKYPVARGR
jgi:hypothetical protein